MNTLMVVEGLEVVHLQFDQIAINNFKSFKGSQLFDLSDFGPGLHFIRGKNQYKPRMGPNGVGKALADSLWVDTPVGRRRWGSLQVGDLLFGRNGEPTKITGKYPQGVKTLYKITFDDGSSTLTCAEHQWVVIGGSAHDKRKYQNKECTLTTAQILEIGVLKHQGPALWRLPNHEAVVYEASSLPVDPYVLGMWLGNGASASGHITVNALDTDVIKCLANYNYVRKKDASVLKRNPVKKQHSNAVVVAIYGLRIKLRQLGLLGLSSSNKFIPELYMCTSVQQRLNLLRGLMDSDGYCGVKGNSRFYSTSKHLAKQVVWLCRSLGGKAWLKSSKPGSYKDGEGQKIVCKTRYDVNLRLDTHKIHFAKRKANRLKVGQARYSYRWISSIEPFRKMPCSCVTVDAKDSLFLANDFIVTHNSAIWDSLCWCLYGRTVRDLRNPDIIPWTGAPKTAVTVWLTIGKVKRQITRTAKPNQLQLDDETIGQDQIENLIGLTKEVFCHTVLLGQGEPLFLDLSPKEKMQVFADVLQLERWEQRAKAASKKAADITSKHDEANGKIGGINSAITQLDNLIKETREKSERWVQERQGDERKQRKELASLQKQLVPIHKLIDDADLTYDSAATEAKAQERMTEKLRDEQIRLHKDLVTIQAEIDVSISAKGKLHKQIRTVGTNKTCPTCGQDIKSTKQLAAHKVELQKQVAGLQHKHEELVATESEIASKVKRINPRLEQSLSHYKEFKEKAETAEATLSLQKRQAADLQLKIAVIEKGLSVSEEQDNPHLAQVKELIRKKNALKGEAKELEELRNKLSRRYERAKFWIKGFKEVQLYIVDEVLQELELVSNTMLTEMGLEDWSLKYAVEKETQSGTVQRGLNVTVLSPENEKAVRWECWSGGEGQRLRVIGALALSEVLLNHAGVTPNIEILDEPTRGLSDEGVNDLCAYLSTRAEQLNKQCWLIDHAAIPSAHFTSTMTVLRDKKGSRLVMTS